MASLNDNLFTKLVDYVNLYESDCFLKTIWGTLKISIHSSNLTAIAFDEGIPPETNNNSAFRTLFMNWLNDFQNMPPETQWHSLSPQGTYFQKSVWRALLEIPFGKKVRYKEIATQIGQPNASRAVGSAIAANPIALLIPCHRVIPSSGGIGNYRWGSARKQALLETETIDNANLYQLFQQT